MAAGNPTLRLDPETNNVTPFPLHSGLACFAMYVLCHCRPQASTLNPKLGMAHVKPHDLDGRKKTFMGIIMPMNISMKLAAKTLLVNTIYS